MGGCREGEKEVLNVVCVKCGDMLRLLVHGIHAGGVELGVW